MTSSHSDALDKFVHDHLEELLDHFAVEYSRSGNRYNAVCPIHDFADNPSALILYKNDGWVYWKCQTRGCQDNYTTRGIDFVKALLERNGDHVSYQKIEDFFKTMGEVGEFNTNKEYLSVLRFINTFGENTLPETPKVELVTRDAMRAKLKLQPPQFLDRKFSPSLLDKYDIGYCDEWGDLMYGRVVIPLYDENANYVIGCTGRTIKDIEPKWLHSKGLTTSNILFNFWYARHFMKDFRTAILCEGPCDALRLIDHSIPAVALFNADLKQGQINLLDKCGVTNLIVMLDHDAAGEAGLAKIRDKFSRYYKIFEVKYSTHDPGDLTSDEIDNDLKPQLRKLLTTNAY